MPMGTIPKEGNVDDAGKGVCDPEKGYHPDSVQRCYLVAKIFHPSVTGLFLCPILVIRIWRGSPVSQILDSKEPCLPTPAPLHCPGSGISTKLSGAFQGSLGWGEAGSHWGSLGFVFSKSPLFPCWKGPTSEEGHIRRRSTAAHRLSPYLGHAFHGLGFLQV